MKWLVFGILAVTPFFPLEYTFAQEEIVTNELVIKMVKAGLSEETIIEKIRSSPIRFDVTTAGLIALKEAGVPDRIIEVMVHGGGRPVSQSPSFSPSAPALAPPSPRVSTTDPILAAAFSPTPVQILRPGIFYIVGGRRVDLEYVIGKTRATGFPNPRRYGILSGARASVRITDDRPTFYLTWNPQETPLLRLDVDLKDRVREAVIGATSVLALRFDTPVQQYFPHIEEKAVTPVEAVKLPSGYWKVTPRFPLHPGEYGFLDYASVGTAAPKIFDFGRD